MNALDYKGYVGIFAYDEDADIFHGRVVGLRDVITFEGRSIDELKRALADSIEDWQSRKEFIIGFSGFKSRTKGADIGGR